MFYNIKIKADGSEFILESSNKEITQREMDIYFSRIFDVSEEFKSQIKDVEVKSQNVISINEFDKHTQNEQAPAVEENFETKIEPQPVVEEIKNEEPVETVKKIVIQEPIKAQNDCVVEAMDNELVFETEEKNEPVNENRIEHIKNAPLTSILIQNEPSDEEQDYVFARQKLLYEEMKKEKEKIDIITEEENQKRLNDIFASDISEYDEDIEDAVVNVKQDIENFANIENQENIIPSSDLVFANQQVEKPACEKVVEQDQEQSIEQVEEQAEETLQEQVFEKVVEQQEQFEPQTIQENEQNLNNENAPSEHDVQIQELEQMLESQTVQNQTQEQQQSVSEEQKDYNNVDIIDLSTFEETNSAINSQVVSTDEIISIREPAIQPQNSQTPDFKTYLEEFDTESLVDDFLICAYYIKNILKQDGFTMKMINSKLFQATGKIADMSVVQELSNKEYISFVQDEISNRYFITPDGENYFQANFE